MAARSGTSHGPGWSDVLAVLNYYRHYYGVAVTFRLFPLMGDMDTDAFGLQCCVYNQYGRHIISRVPTYVKWPSINARTFPALAYQEALRAEDFVKEVALTLAEQGDETRN